MRLRDLAAAADLATGTPGAPPAATLDPEIATIVQQVSEAKLTKSITMLSGFTTRNTCSDDTPQGGTIGSARDWIKGQLQAIPGLTVTLDPFTYGGCGAASVTRENVVAVLPGTHRDRVVVLGGHYDSRTFNVTDGTSRSPGANDSGSQTALVLEAARVLAGHTFDTTLVFVAFAGEEQGLIGSAHLAKSYPQYVSPSAKVEEMLNCDIVGGDSSVNTAATFKQFRLFSPGTPREIATPMGTTDDTSPARGLMRYIGYWGGGYVPAMAMVPMLREDRPSRGGDHESFLDQAYPAVRFIETVESPNAGTQGSHQHSPDDLATFVTPSYTAHITQVVVAVAASLARAPAAPGMITASGTASAPVTVTWSAPATGPAVDHYVLAARSTAENFYHTRVPVGAGATSSTVAAGDLGIAGAASFFVSVAAVDAAGHESPFAYPEYRCDSTGCAVEPDALMVTTRK